MPDAIITSTESTFGTISGTFAESGATISGTISGVVAGTLDGSVGVPGPAGAPGATGPQGPQGQQGEPGVPGVGVPAGGTAGQVLAKVDGTDYNTEWVDDSASLTATAPLSIVDGVLSIDGSGYYPASNPDDFITETLAASTFYPLEGNPSAFIDASALTGYATQSWVTAGFYPLSNPSGFVPASSLGSAAYQPTSYWIQSPAVAALDGQIPIWDAATGRSVWSDNAAVTLTATVRNETGATLTKGTVVYINGGSGNKPLVVKASASSESGSSKTFAILSQDIPTNQNGQAVTMGLLKGLDTTGFTAGANLWLSTTAGQITSTPPVSPAHAVFLGNAVRIHATQGEIEVRIQNGLELGELHDVLLTSPTNGQVLKYDSASGLWVNRTDVGGVAWGSITGTLSSQTDLQTALDGKYSTTNPAGYITSAALSGYATESFVTSQGYITSSALSPYLTSATAASTYQTISGMSSYLTTASAASTYFTIANAANKADLASPVFTGDPRAPTPATADNDTSIATTAFVKAQSYSTETWVINNVNALLNDYANVDFSNLQNPSLARTNLGLGTMATQTAADYSTTAVANGLYYPLSSNPSGYLTSSALTGYATETYVNSQGFITSAALSPYLTSSTAASTYQTIAGMSSYLTTSAAASTYYPLSSNPAGYLTSAPVTSVAGKTGAVSLVVADVSGAAPLASPALTGVPTAPTATAGTNTTQIATTAFVLANAGSTTFATNAQAIVGTSTTTSLSPSLTPALITRPELRSLAHIFYTAVSGSGAVTSGAVNFGQREMYLATLATGRANFTYGLPGANSVNMSRTSNNQINFSKKIWIGGKCMVGSTIGGTNYNGDTNTFTRITLGGYSSQTTGDMTVKGIGWKKQGGLSPFFTLTVHDGTTRTDVASTVAQADGQTIDWQLYSDGAGNVTLYIDGVQAATTSAGPTGMGTNNATAYREQVEAATTPGVRAVIEATGGWLYIEG
jgi:hypothetical protein